MAGSWETTHVEDEYSYGCWRAKLAEDLLRPEVQIHGLLSISLDRRKKSRLGEVPHLLLLSVGDGVNDVAITKRCM